MGCSRRFLPGIGIRDKLGYVPISLEQSALSGGAYDILSFQGAGGGWGGFRSDLYAFVFSNSDQTTEVFPKIEPQTEPRRFPLTQF